MVTYVFLPGDSFPGDGFVRDELEVRLGGDWVTLAPAAGQTCSTRAVIERRVQFLEAFIATMDVDNVILVGRSSGARVITLAAIRHLLGDRVAGLVCLGYPFRHPSRDAEPERYEHLADLILATVMFQGRHDEYGGVTIAADYALPAHMGLHFHDGSHNMKTLSADDWTSVADRTAEFVSAVMRQVRRDTDGQGSSHMLRRRLASGSGLN